MSGILIAVAIGIAFGFALERAGLGSAPKLAGQFYLTDLTVFKVMFSAVVTAMLGAFWLGRLGVLDLSRVYVPETWLLPQLAGGLLFGVGFALAGLCPGTSCVAAATGRGDGAMVMLGMFAGMLATGLAFAPLEHFYESTSRGALTLPQLLGVRYGIVVGAMVLMALVLFFLAPRSGERVDLSVAKGRVRGLAVAAGLLGLLAAVLPAAAHRPPPPADQQNSITALELAQWLHDRKPALRVIDLRTAEAFEEYHLPRAERVDATKLAATPFGAKDTIVLISAGGIHAAQGQELLRTSGHRQVYVLRGGVQVWIDDVMSPTVASNASPAERAAFDRVAVLSRYFGGVPRVTDQPQPRAADTAASIRRRGC
jgi:rhodanese-related sulfurtransferase/uncharacterized membrane protein YedE/YeeE